MSTCCQTLSTAANFPSARIMGKFLATCTALVSDWVNCLAFSPLGDALVVGVSNGSLRLYNVESGVSALMSYMLVHTQTYRPPSAAVPKGWGLVVW